MNMHTDAFECPNKRQCVFNVCIMKTKLALRCYTPLSPFVGGPGGDSAWRGEGSDVQGVLAVGVRGQSSDAVRGLVRSPERSPWGLRSGSGCNHTASAFHEVLIFNPVCFLQTHLPPLFPSVSWFLFFTCMIYILYNGCVWCIISQTSLPNSSICSNKPQSAAIFICLSLSLN